MAKIKDTKKDTLAIIDSALAIINKFPDLEQTDVSLSIDSSMNPLPFLMDLFKRTAGYNVMIDIVSKIIALNLPVIEAGVKTVLITKLKDIISCSVNPFITDEILREGIVLNISEIDIADILKYSPFDDEIGKYFYFDTGNYEIKLKGIDANTGKKLKRGIITGTPDDLIKSDDLNCLIWFMINKASKRYVWKPKKYRKGPEFRYDYPDNEEKIDEIKHNLEELVRQYKDALANANEQEEKIITKELKIVQKKLKDVAKLKKEDGIITLEYHKKPTSMKDAYGQKYSLQTPHQNCLHVFIGDTREKITDNSIENLTKKENGLQQEDKKIERYNAKIQEKTIEIENLSTERSKLYEKKYTSEKDLQKEYNKYTSKIKKLEKEIERIKEKKELSYQSKAKLNYAIQGIKDTLNDTTTQYFPFMTSNGIRNYYHGKSLIQFNIDYITSLDLFDAKSLAARLLDCMTASLIIDLHLSYKTQLIKNEVKKMVQMITETDDVVISDCFFAFSNKDYDEMSRKAELRKAGLLTINGDETSAVKIDVEKIFSKLNEINKDTDKETVQSIISGSITELSKELSSVEYSHEDNTGEWHNFTHGKSENYGVEINFIENILNSLAEVITMAVLSPKVYLLLLINLKIIGRETNFNLEGFLLQYRQLIADIIRSIRDIIIDYITKELMVIINDLVKEISFKLNIEQVLYWQRLLKKLIDSFRFRKQNGYTIDFNIDSVDYADILPSETSPKDSEC